MINVINIVYIDDNPEPKLTKYLEGPFSTDYSIDSKEVIFFPEKGYKSLLVDPRVKEANIAVIDSKLFENRTSHDGFFTGEEFLIVLKKLFPFIETIIVSQNDLTPAVDYVKKYEHSTALSAQEYYDGVLKDRIITAIESIQRYLYLAGRVKDNDSWDQFLKDKVLRTLNGSDEYDDLTKSDLDEIIAAFRRIQEALDNG